MATVTVTATDVAGSGDSAVSNAFDITITAAAPVNQAPTFAGSIADATYTEALPITELDVSAFFSDPESDELTFSTSALPTGLSISTEGEISGTPTAAGTTSVTVTASDETGSGDSAVSNAFDIVVTL